MLDVSAKWFMTEWVQKPWARFSCQNWTINTQTNASFHTLKDDSHTPFYDLPARMAAHIFISTPSCRTNGKLYKNKQTQKAHIPPTGDYTGHAYLIFVRAFSLSLVKQSRESIRISRGFENTKTQLEASQDVLVRREITTPASTSFFSHLIHWLAHQTCYMKPPAGTF